MKAWSVFPGDAPCDDGCIIVYAPTKNKAKLHAHQYGPWLGYSYVDYKAKRLKDYDKFHDSLRPTTPYHYESNIELPGDAPEFWDQLI